jgi:hypothetical protein
MRRFSQICAYLRKSAPFCARRGVQYTERARSPREYCDLFRETFGPVAALYASLDDQPERLAALDRDFLDFAMRANTGPPGGPAEYVYEYLLVVARKR